MDRARTDPTSIGKESPDAAIAVVFMTNPLLLPYRYRAVLLLVRSPEWGTADCIEGGARARRAGTSAVPPWCWSRSIHLQFFMAGLAEGTQRIGESVTDRLSDPGERRVFLGISIDDHSQCFVCLGDDFR
jgi:hypothetical protein